MCGIVGYVGSHEAIDYLISGLRRLEYRGYDSSGVALITPERHLTLCKSAGRIDRLEARLAETQSTGCPSTGRTGIGHTRWATHGAPSDINAHPHLGGDGEIAVVHNGVIENFQSIKRRLVAEGYAFHSATDTEVIAHLMASCLKRQPPVEDMAALEYRPLVAAVQEALLQLQGTYGLTVLFRDWPEVLIVARLGSPDRVGRRQRRALRGQRRLALGGLHGQDRLPGRSTSWPC